ncbi:MAG: BACON domain-containing protein [Bacteroidales bacterium]|nr:BACON domain-containing protein [Bacteroidales bacterium]
MKKFFSILFSAIVMAGLASCADDVQQMASQISVDPGSVTIESGGLSFVATVKADGIWTSTSPDWVTLSPAYGTGDTQVSITVAPNSDATRSGKISFESAIGAVSSTNIDLDGAPQSVIAVTQAGDGGGSGGTKIVTCKQFCELPDDDLNTYQISGSITRIVNTKFGNFDITDASGGTVYIYGLLTPDLRQQVCFNEQGLAMGDEVTVTGTRTKWGSTIEIVDAVYVSHVKSLLSLEEDSATVGKDGGSFTIVADAKGSNVNVSFAEEWLECTNIEKSGDVVTLTIAAAANLEAPRNAVITLSSATESASSTVIFTVEQEGNINPIDIGSFIALDDDPDSWFRIKGYVTSINNIAKGRFDLTDATGKVYCYNIATEKGGSTNLTGKFEVGDVVTVVAYKTTYSGTIEAVGYLEAVEKVTVSTLAQMTANRTSGATVEGTVVAVSKQGFVIDDGTDAAYVYAGKTFDPTLFKIGDKAKVKVADGKNVVYNFATEINGYEIAFKSGSVADFVQPKPKTADAAFLDAAVAAIDGKDKSKDDLVSVEYVTIEGKLSKSGNYYNIVIDGTAVQCSVSNPLDSLNLDALDGKNITISGYAMGISGSGTKYYNFIAVSAAEKK